MFFKPVAIADRYAALVWVGFGQFEVGSTPDGSVCPTYCLAIDWPGAQTNLDGDNPTPAGGAAWFGSLITGRRDGPGMTYLRNRYYDRIERTLHTD